MHFDVPESRRKVNPNPKSLKEEYANSVYLVDEGIGYFWKELQSRPELRNTIVIITGDHPFPLGDHGITHNEDGFYDESFRMPFLLLFPQEHLHETIRNQPFSQLDIAPTLVDLAQLTVERNNFQGVSLFRKNREHLVYSVQPYNGRYISIVNFPYKFIYHVKSKQAYLFDLTSDPSEEHNLIDNVQYRDQVVFFKDKLKYVYLNQALLERNQLWTATPGRIVGKHTARPETTSFLDESAH
jgi:arylsulfatase A-like enzyme